MIIKHDNILIRGLKPEDTPIIHNWWNDGSIMAHAGFPRGLDLSLKQVESELKTNPDLHIIEFQEQPIGEIHYRSLDEDSVTIGIKICNSNFQNRGLGKIVLSLFIAQLFKEGRQSIRVEANLNNLPAQKVYQDLGFQQLKITKNSWTDQLGQLQSSIHYQLLPQDFINHSKSLS